MQKVFKMKYVVYLRVSTAMQSDSGLGLAAQENACREFIQREGGELISVFSETASGGNDDRPILKEAVEACKKSGAILLAASLSRLARSVSKIDALQKAVEFIALDNIGGDFLGTGVKSLMSEYEKKLVSQRTSAALMALSRSGKALGFRNECRTGDAVECNRKSAAVRGAKANAFAVRLETTVRGYISQGITSTVKIADELNNAGLRTVRGNEFKPTTVNRLLKRLEVLAA